MNVWVQEKIMGALAAPISPRGAPLGVPGIWTSGIARRAQRTHARTCSKQRSSGPRNVSSAGSLYTPRRRRGAGVVATHLSERRLAPNALGRDGSDRRVRVVVAPLSACFRVYQVTGRVLKSALSCGQVWASTRAAAGRAGARCAARVHTREPRSARPERSLRFACLL